MVIQIRKFQVNQGDPVEICRRAAEKLPSILEKLPGFIDYYVVNGKGGYVFSVTVFEDENGLNQAFELVRHWTNREVKDMLSEPEIVQGDVIYAHSEMKKKAA